MHENRAESAKWRARCCLHVSLGVLRSFDGTHGEVGTQALTREGLERALKAKKTRVAKITMSVVGMMKKALGSRPGGNCRTSASVAAKMPSITMRNARRKPAMPRRRWISTRPAETSDVCVTSNTIQAEKAAPCKSMIRV